MADPSAEVILQKADEVRSPQLDYKTLVNVTSIKPGRDSRTAQYEVLIKGRSKPLRISLQQRFFGDVSNGDIARANFSGDYNPKILRIENIDEKEYYVLELFAKDDQVTYHRVILWVQKDNFHPFKAEFYAVSGRILKTCSYEGYRLVLDRLRPTRLVLDDPLVQGKRSIIEYKDMTLTDLPNKYFTKTYLKKLKY
jgi:hypothetical protein